MDIWKKLVAKTLGSQTVLDKDGSRYRQNSSVSLEELSDPRRRGAGDQIYIVAREKSIMFCKINKVAIDLSMSKKSLTFFFSL